MSVLLLRGVKSPDRKLSVWDYREVFRGYKPCRPAARPCSERLPTTTRRNSFPAQLRWHGSQELVSCWQVPLDLLIVLDTSLLACPVHRSVRWGCKPDRQPLRNSASSESSTYLRDELRCQPRYSPSSQSPGRYGSQGAR